jgi:MFS superfamily sulfate permease-like transporter
MRGFLQRHVPILVWLPGYDRTWLRTDLIAGLAIWSVTVPQGLGYAGIAGVPAVYGLYTVPLAMIGYAIFRFDAELYFTNADFFSGEVRRHIAEAGEPVHEVLVNAETINDIDTTGVDQLIELNDDLEKLDIRLRLAHVKERVRDLMDVAGAGEAIGEANIFESVQDGIDDYLRRQA